MTLYVNENARPMARVIQEWIKTPLAEGLQFGRLAGGGGRAEVDVKLSPDGIV